MAGNTFDIVVLSSSPPETEPPLPALISAPPNESPHERVLMSPRLRLPFSPPTSPKKKLSGALKSGSRAAPIPSEAVRGFATARSLVRPEHLQEPSEESSDTIRHAQPLEGVLDEVEKTTKAKSTKSRKKASSKSATADDNDKPETITKGRKSKADKTPVTRKPTSRKRAPTTSAYFDVTATENIGSVETAVHTTSDYFAAAASTVDGPNPPEIAAVATTKKRKPRTKKDNIDGNETAVTKKKTSRARPKKTPKANDKTQEEDKGTGSERCRNDQSVRITHTSAETESAKAGDQSLWGILQSPRLGGGASEHPTTGPLPDNLDLEQAVRRRREWTPPMQTETADSVVDIASKENDFTNMISGFAYAHVESGSLKLGAEPTVNAGVTKRRRVELLDLPGHSANSRNSSPEKGKAPKKKPRTITDLVTGQYSLDRLPQGHTLASEDHQPTIISAKVPLKDDISNDAACSKQKPASKCSSSKTTSGKRERKSKTAPPKSAAKVKFVADKLLSPSSAMRRLDRQDVLFGTSSQLALDESPGMLRAIQQAMQQSEQDSETLPGIGSKWPRLARIEGKQGLWNASSRNEAGGLLEKGESVYIPEPDRREDIPLLLDSTQGKKDDEPEPEFDEIDDFELPRPKAAPLDSSPPSLAITPQVSRSILQDTADAVHMSFEDIDDYMQEPPPSNQNAESHGSFLDIDDFDFQPPPAVLPSNAQSVSLSGSPKKRAGRVAKPQTATATAPKRKASLADENKPALPSTPHKTKGRFAHVEEILDSEDEALEAFSPTPPRIRPLQKLPSLPLAPQLKPSTTAPKQQGLIPVFRVPTAELQWQTIKPAVLSAITLHVRNLPPSTNSEALSWHERILMFEPIILEDFTQYLNSYANIHTYRRATKVQIKEWNKKLKANGDPILQAKEEEDEVLAINKELEPWMIQVWCQEKSICCVWGQNRGRGHFGQSFY